MAKCFKTDFCVLKVTGSAEKLLTGLATNIISAPRSAFIDVYGRIVAVFYQKQHGNDVYIAFPDQFRTRLDGHLGKYLAISKAKIEETDLKAFFVIENNTDISGIKIDEKNYTLLLAKNTPVGVDELSAEEFKTWRLENSVSLQGEEFDSEMIMNTDWNDAVSFSKGCFLGQEIAVKIMHRGKPPRKLQVMQFDSEKEMNSNPKIEFRSKCFSKKFGKWLAYCSVPNDTP